MVAGGGRFLGITVMPEYIQSEGVEAVLDGLARAGATAVTTSPYVMAPADEATGGAREPPIDAGAGGVRLLDRPLWGRRELFVRTAPSFVPERSLYAGLRYQPPMPDEELTGREGPVVGAFVRAAKARGLKVYLQVQAAIPPGYRVQFGGPIADDEPLLPDGRAASGRLDRNGSLASPHVRDYGCALIRDLGRAYPEIDGLRVGWPEYPPYALDSLFLDFGLHAEAAAERLGFDFGRMRADALVLYRRLHGGLADADLAPWLATDGGRYHLLRLLAAHPGVLDLLRFKAALVEELLAAYRVALTDALGPEAELLPQAFPPPWSLASGFDYRRAARHAGGILVKLYTMHWPMMLRFYGDQLRAANPRLDERLLARCLFRLLDLADADGPARIDLFRYPEPDEPHPVGAAAQARKIRAAQAEADGVPVYAVAHGYGPVEDFRERAEVAWRASGRRLWVNRYGYLGDAKLDALGALD